MSTYKIEQDKLMLVKEKPFKLEKDIQGLVEKNLSTLLGIEFIKTEFALHEFRIDTLAFDPENKSFVIIEFKRDKSFSVVDQGYAYLALMLNNKADFILEYNESKGGNLLRKDVDWSQSKVIFISPNFTTYQREAINFKDLPIELWEIKRFANNTLSFDQIISRSSKESIKAISNNKTVEKVSEEIRVYNENDHLSNTTEDIQSLYEELKEYILSLNDEISIKPKKKTIGFLIGKKVFCDIIVQNKSIKMRLNAKKGTLNDSEKITRDISSIGHWGNGDYEILFPLKDNDDIESVYSLIRQTLKINKEIIK